MSTAAATERKGQTSWTVYRRLLAYSRQYMPRLIVGLSFGLLYGAANGGLVWAIKGGIGKVFRPGDSTWQEVMLAVSIFPVVAVIRGVGDFGSKYFIKWVGHRVILDLRCAMYRRLLDLPISFFSDRRTGELISRVTNDPVQVETAVSTVIADIAKEPVTLVAMVVAAFVLDARLAALSLVLFPASILPVVVFGQRLRRNARQAQERIADLMSILQETITGMRIVKAYGMEAREEGRFLEYGKTFFGRVMRMIKARDAVEPLVVLVSCLGVALVMVYAHVTHMTVDQIIAFAAALMLMYEPIKRLSAIHLHVQQSSAAAERIFELLDSEISVADRPGAVGFSGAVDRVTFDRVSFAYAQAPVLRSVSFEVSMGMRVAIVGSSGSGKTTLVNLIPRFADVTEGAIRLNGTDIRDLTMASLRRTIGMVTQETILFNDTVASNIRYGSPDAPITEVVEAARKAHAHAFISEMPQGYDTIIGEHGVRLSGGQRQRLAIARAILRNPPIMIMDEATSALDTESERIVQAALDEVMEGRTVFVIAHRLSTIANCDRILVLAEGQVVEEGSPAELLARDGLYRHLHDLQFSPGRDSGG